MVRSSVSKVFFPVLNFFACLFTEKELNDLKLNLHLLDGMREPLYLCFPD